MIHWQVVRLVSTPPGARHQRFVLGWNDQRLAVWDRDVDAIIATHVRGGGVAAWFQGTAKDTAKALAEIGGERAGHRVGAEGDLLRPRPSVGQGGRVLVQPAGRTSPPTRSSRPA